MKIHLFLISFFLTVALSSLQAQIFPYLNASTGNENEYIVNADSNIFMFYGNRIEKRDKHFNVIWVNTYSGLTFKNLLLSKTGSLFFIATDSVFYDRLGKIEANGDLDWCKSIPKTPLPWVSWDAHQLQLDRNNQLIITGGSIPNNGGLFLKTDTLGNIIKQKIILRQNEFPPEKSYIINDSAGIYTVSTWGMFFETYVQTIFKYSDFNDSIFKETVYGTLNGFGAGMVGWQDGAYIAKSKNQNNASYLSTNSPNPSGTFPNTFNLIKNVGLFPKWKIEFYSISPYLHRFQNIEEGDNKTTYLYISTINTNTQMSDKWVLKIDSNGYTNGKKYYPEFSLGIVPELYQCNDSVTNLRLTRHYGNVFFYSAISHSPTDTVQIALMDSTLDEFCSITGLITVTTNTIFPNSTSYPVSKVQNIFLTPLNTETITINSPNISRYLSNCLEVNTQERNNIKRILVYPNPASNSININSSPDFGITESTVFDIYGKIVLFETHQTNIDISKLNSGIYFIKVVTDKGEYKQKFIKE